MLKVNIRTGYKKSGVRESCGGTDLMTGERKNKQVFEQSLTFFTRFIILAGMLSIHESF